MLADEDVASVFADIAVCIPTVRQRAAVLEVTLAEWRRFGVTPLVQRQPDDWPLDANSIRRNADDTLRRALDERPDACHILFSEDDILLGAELARWIPALTALNAAATLFLHGLDFYPRDITRLLRQRSALIPERIIRVRRLSGWFGSQAVLLPRGIVEMLLAWPSTLSGWDVHLQRFLVTHGLPMYAPTLNPVQHQAPPTLIRPTTWVVRSATFGRAGDGGGISPPKMDWCPAGNWELDPRMP